MAKILLISDTQVVLDELESVVDDGNHEIGTMADGTQLRQILAEDPPDLIIADAQIGNMGGVAIAHDVKLEESYGRLQPVGVLVLLDRRAEVHLARRSGADGWIVKPFDSIRIRAAVESILSGERFEDDSFKPFDTMVAQNESI
jgi:DNA-binding response OmpR family regulator